MPEDQPSERRLESAFQRAVLPAHFGGVKPEQHPVLVLLGGQPGAGKSVAQQRIRQELGRPVGLVVGDDFRVHHPGQRRLARELPLQMPDATARTAGWLVNRSLDHAYEHRLPILLEGTFRDPQLVSGTVERFRSAGFRVEAHVVAVPSVITRLSIESRFLTDQRSEARRWTPPLAHDLALAGVDATVRRIEPTVDLLRVTDRTAATLYESSRARGSADAVVRGQLGRELTATEISAWLAQHGDVRSRAEHVPGYLDHPQEVRNWARLDHAAHQLGSGSNPLDYAQTLADLRRTPGAGRAVTRPAEQSRRADPRPSPPGRAEPER